MSRIYALILILLASLATVQLKAHPSWGIVVDHNKNIFFADIGHNQMGSVWKLTNDGQLVLLLSNFHAHNINLDSEGNLYTAHGEGNHTMVRISPEGRIDTLFTTHDHNAFFGGNCAYTPFGEIIFSIDHFLWKLDKHGKKQKLSPHHFEWNQSIYADNLGNVFAPDKAINNGSLFKIDSDGHARLLGSNLLATLDRPRDKHNDVLLGMTSDKYGNAYICENAGQRILKLKEGSPFEVFYTSSENWFPTGITFHENEAYILEYTYTSNGMAGPQIVHLTSGGKKTLLFNYDEYLKKGPPEKLIIKQRSKFNFKFLIPILFAILLLVTLFKKTKAI